jgi:hypothetical protein
MEQPQTGPSNVVISFLSHTLPCRWALLEYAEDQRVEDFDLSIPLNPQLIEQVITPRYPHLVDKLSDLQSKDRLAGVMIDRFSQENIEPAVVAYGEPESFLSEWGATAVYSSDKELYATVVYPARDNLVRLVYRNPEQPAIKTDVHAGDGSFSHHEFLHQGSLPAHLNWMGEKLEALRARGVTAQLNHFKDLGDNSKVYFRITTNPFQ